MASSQRNSAPVSRGHNRQISEDRRRVTPRRMTKGPLDAPEPPLSRIYDPLLKNSNTISQPRPANPYTLDIPPSFRASSHQPASSTPLPTLLRQGHFRAAAITAAQTLTTTTAPSDTPAIFSLFYTRLATLTLIDSTVLAAQEVKALEDLSSSYYRDPLTHAHLVPWELRVLAVRLQGIGFGDWRRGVMGYYELAREARAEAAKARVIKNMDEYVMWEARLEDLGLRVVNALVEMGDLESARLHLESLDPGKRRQGRADSADETATYKARLALLYLQMGDVGAASRLFPEESDEAAASEAEEVIDRHTPTYAATTALTIRALCTTASGDYPAATVQWKRLIALHTQNQNESIDQRQHHNPNLDLPTINIALSHLYSGHLPLARETLESLLPSLAPSSLSSPNTNTTSPAPSDNPLAEIQSESQANAATATTAPPESEETSRPKADVAAPPPFHALLFNLATIYELCTERSRNLKERLAENIASVPPVALGAAGDGKEDGVGGGLAWEKRNADFKL
ncbi:MAG: hypothetical protein M1819_003915 [Sarea resinae]|nr:MAG: hypothetical protein M1819_003915 [Sarea resinae]